MGMTLALSQVGVTLGDHAVLSGIDLHVVAGELLVLVGPNGAGKTTLLSVLSGDLAPTTGQATLDGKEVHRTGVRDLALRRAMLPQENRLSFGFRVVDVVRMGRTPWIGRPEEDEDDRIVAEALARADVTGLAARTYSTLSGGEKSRSSFARVLAQSTPLVLLDEPTAALDIRHQEHVLAEAVEVTRRGGSVVAVMHDLSLAAAYADRICVLDQGRLQADGTPADVLEPGLLQRVYRHRVDVIRHNGRLVTVPERISSPTGHEALREVAR